MARIPIDDDEANPAQDGGDDQPDGKMAEVDDQNVEEAQPQRQQPGQPVDVQKLQEERDRLYDRLARSTAEFRNTQRRLEQEKEQAVQYANSSLLKSLLPVIDNFERALAVDPQKTDLQTVLKGMQIVHDQMIKVLEQQHVEQVAPEPGTPFDPNHHQALMQQDSDEYDQPTVTQMFQKGYTLHGRTLRPAGVAVSKSK